MARRRMFTTEFVDADRFLDLPVNVQMLYIYMNLHADDEGFVGGSKRMAALYECPDGLDLLERENYIIRFDSGILAIVDWHLNNTIRKDRSVPTFHQTERQQLQVINGRYTRMTTHRQPNDNQMSTNWQPDDNQMSTNWQPNDNHLATQNREEENIIDNNIINKNKSEYIISEQTGGDKSATWEPETSDDKKYPDIMTVFNYCREQNLNYVNIGEFCDYYQQRNWCDDDGKPIEDWKYVLRLRNASEFSSRLASGLEI
ncbi:MAG: hypothetical protein IKW10_04610 [Oscillospiraceae bacterium]|nr:hypothetical protein [Oscillospiraceae bacterium]